MVKITGGPNYFSVEDVRGEFGFIEYSKTNKEWQFKIIEEVHLNVEYLEIIAAKLKELNK